MKLIDNKNFTSKLKRNIVSALNDKTPAVIARALKFGRYLFLPESVPNNQHYPVIRPPVNTTTYNTVQQWTISTAARYAVSNRFYCAWISLKQFKITVINWTTPRTVRQSYWNMLEKGNPITAVFTMQERAVGPSILKVIHRVIHR